MEEILIWIMVCTVSFSAALLTFFSGFGLGTLLLPVFSLIMPIQLAVLSTALVHISNNAIKFVLIRHFIDKRVLLSFGITAVFGALIGASFQKLMGEEMVIYNTCIFLGAKPVTLLAFIVGLLMILFAILDFLPLLKKISFGKVHFPVGGFLSGFFGGLSGHQGALRAAFLSKSGLKAEVFIATSVCMSLLIDVVRIPIYLSAETNSIIDNKLNIILACFFAFIGSYLGKRIFVKRKVKNIRWVVAFFLFTIGIGMLTGLV
jgi:uncharacterized membrane protein YfcA